MSLEPLVEAAVQGRLQVHCNADGLQVATFGPGRVAYVLVDVVGRLQQESADQWRHLLAHAPQAVRDEFTVAAGLHAAARAAAARGAPDTPRRDDLPPDHDSWLAQLDAASQDAMGQAEWVHARWREALQGQERAGTEPDHAQRVLQVLDGLVAVSAAIEEFLPWDKRTEGRATLRVNARQRTAQWLGGSAAARLDLPELVEANLALATGLVGPELVSLVDVVVAMMVGGTLPPQGMTAIESSSDGAVAYQWRRG